MDRYRQVTKNPSFSSTLLDAIYRSIDEGGECEGDEEVVLCRESVRKKLQSGCDLKEERKVSEKVFVRSELKFDRKLRSFSDSPQFNSNSNSSSEDSSCFGGFSSSDAESVYQKQRLKQKLKPKPVRTSVVVNRGDCEMFDRCESNREKEKREGGFVKTKSRALKIYGDLKKVKQPISPGGRLASFLNSIFATGNAKKPKISSPATRVSDDASFDRKSKSAHASVCSSTSSFSRSCLSKTPSSSSNGEKRSVRFYPISVIVDEDCRPCGQKSVYKDEELRLHLMEKNRRVEEAARQLLKSYHKKNNEYNMRQMKFNDTEDDDDDDDASCSSSDLFELDNLAAIGIERYREELPVYETTHLRTNHAIANGLIL